MASATSFDFDHRPRAHAKPTAQHMPPHDHSFTLSAAIGAAASVIGVVTTFQEEIEWWVRITGGVVTILIGVLSLVHMVRKLAPPPAKRKVTVDDAENDGTY